MLALSRVGKLAKKILRYLAKFTAIIGVLLVAIVVAFYTFVLVQNEWVSQRVENILRTQTSLAWQIQGRVELFILPDFGFAIKGLVLPNLEPLDAQGLPAKEPLLALERVDVHLDLALLLRGQLSLSNVKVLSPKIIVDFTEDATGGTADEVVLQELTRSKELQPSSPPTLSARANSESLKQDMATLVSDVLAKIFATDLPQVNITNGRAVHIGTDGLVVEEFTNVSVNFKPLAESGELNFSGVYVAPQAGFSSKLQLRTILGGESTLATGSISGTLEFAPKITEKLISGSFATDFHWNRNENLLFISDLLVEAEGDALKAKLAFDWQDLSLSGKVIVPQFSLPRWFLFARILTPELQEAMHAVEGSFDLHIDKKGLLADNLVAHLGGLEGRGFVRVVDFHKPVVEVAINLPRVSVDNIFPFLAPPNALVPAGVAPVFAHKYLVPFENSEKKEPVETTGQAAVGYDVTIRADAAVVHGMSGGRTVVSIFPLDRTTHRVDFTGQNILSGSVFGQLDFKQDQIAMKYGGRSLHLLPLPENQGNNIVADARLSGECTVTIPVVEGKWGDTSQISLDFLLADFTLRGGQATGSAWQVASKRTVIRGDGALFILPEAGIRVDANLSAEHYGAYSTWNPDGSDDVNTLFQGRVTWPPFANVDKGTRQRDPIEQIQGQLTIAGNYTLPLGNVLVPVVGKLSTQIDWRTASRTLTYSAFVLNSFGSVVNADGLVDFSRDSVMLRGQGKFDVALKNLLEKWEMTPGESIKIPENISGELNVFADKNSIRFDEGRFFVDGTALKGSLRCDFGEQALQVWSGVPPFAVGRDTGGVDNTSVFFGGNLIEGLNLESPQQPNNSLRRVYFLQVRDKYITKKEQASRTKAKLLAQTSGRAGLQLVEGVKALWTIRLYGASLDLDKLIISGRSNDNFDPEAPLDVSFLRGLNLDAKINAGKVTLQNLDFLDVALDARIEENRFALRLKSQNFYGGRFDYRVHGVAILPSTVHLDVFAAEVADFDLGQVLNILTKQTAYSGMATLGFHLSGEMQKQGDLPRNLSGYWNFSAQDGSYPALLGGRSSGQSNSFSTVEASGNMENGVLQWRNFRLRGPVINIVSAGWVDLGEKMMDISATVTVARIPTIPVRVYGSFESPSLDLHRTRMVLQTVQAAGGTVFSLVRGVFYLPGAILSYIGAPSEGAGTVLPNAGQGEEGKPAH